MQTDEKESETEVDAYDSEHGSYEPNVPVEAIESRLPFVSLPMAPKAPPFKIS